MHDACTCVLYKIGFPVCYCCCFCCRNFFFFVQFRILSMLISNHVNIIPIHKPYTLRLMQTEFSQRNVYLFFGGGENKKRWLCFVAFVSCVSSNLYRKRIRVHCLQENSHTIHKNWMRLYLSGIIMDEKEEKVRQRNCDAKKVDFSSGNLFFFGHIVLVNVHEWYVSILLYFIIKIHSSTNTCKYYCTDETRSNANYNRISHKIKSTVL